jgi:ribosomal-protein-alanine N-acetyltransferase
MTKPIIRKMTSLDLDAVLGIETVCSVDPWTRAIFLGCLERHHCYVITLDRQVIGFAVLMFIQAECQILNISISPEHQRHGHGHNLLKDLIESARLAKATDLLLEVRCSNAPAISLYQKMGFVIIGHRKDYYLTLEGREDAHVMLLKL